MATDAMHKIGVEGIIYLTQGRIWATLKAMKNTGSPLPGLAGILLATHLVKILTRRVSVVPGLANDGRGEQVLNGLLGCQIAGVLLGDLR